MGSSFCEPDRHILSICANYTTLLYIDISKTIVNNRVELRCPQFVDTYAVRMIFVSMWNLILSTVVSEIYYLACGQCPHSCKGIRALAPTVGRGMELLV